MGAGKRPTEPWLFGEDSFNSIKQIIALRYRLAPYILRALTETSRTGLPFNRPLWFDFPGCVKCWDIADEYMVGPDMLAAPVVTVNATSRAVYLPPLPGAGGTEWRHFFTGQELEGGENVTVQAPMWDVGFPLFVRTDRRDPTGGAASVKTDEADLVVELGSAVAPVEHQATGFLQAINATFPPSSTLVPLRIHGHRTNLGGINHSYDRLKALGVKVFHCVVSDSYPGPCAGGVAPLGGCPGDIRSDGTVSWHEWDTVIDSHIAALADKPTVYYDVRAVFFLSVASVAALLT